MRTVVALTVALAACQGSLAAQKKPVTQPLVTAAIAGQGVALLPITMVVTEPTVPKGALPAERAVLLQLVDSMLADGAVQRAPEVSWVPPADLRRMARRGGGLVPNPDQMGQSIMRTWSLTSIPDPLRSNLRKLLAVAGGWRFALIPASLIFRIDSAGALAADLSVLLADTRTGRVVWRSIARGRGEDATEVLGKAVATIFPVEGEGREP